MPTSSTHVPCRDRHTGRKSSGSGGLCPSRRWGGLGCGVAIVLAFLTAWTSPAAADPVADLTGAYQRGVALYREGRFAEAADEFEQAVQLAPQVYGRGERGPVNRNTILLMKWLANCHLEAFHFAEAEDLYHQCLAAARQEEGADSPTVLDCKDHLGNIYWQLNQWDRAETYYREVLDADDDPLRRAITANNLAYLYMTIDRHEEARQYFEQSLAVWKSETGRDARLNRALCVHGLGMVAQKQGRYDEAVRQFRQALDERQRLLPADHHHVQHSKGMLAIAYSSLGRDKDAEPLLREARRGMASYWGRDDHVEVARVRHELALLLARQGDAAGALAEFGTSRRAFRRYIGRTLTGLAQDAQLRFLAEERGRFMDALAALDPQQPSSARQSLEWVLNEKGLIQETLAERKLLARGAALDPRLSDVVASLAQVRQRLAALTTAGATGEARTQDEQLTAREAELVRQLGLESLRHRPDDLWVPLPDVAEALPDDAVLVEIVRLDRSQPSLSAYNARIPDAQTQPRYCAWTLRGDTGRVRLVDLGPAGPIESLIGEFRQHMSEREKIFHDPSAATKSVKKTLRSLSRHVLWPLLPELQGVKRWIVSPDAKLWLVPWSALLLPDGNYAVEEATISHAVSGRSLAVAAAPRETRNQALIMADPNFGLTPERIAQITGRPASDPKRRSATRGESGAMTAVPRAWGALAGTRREAEAIRGPIGRYVGGDVQVLLGDRALETFFKAPEHARPRVAVLATHGFFLEPTENGLDNPLLRCGLVLAGANARSVRNPMPDDGILTGMEVLESDLRGTELVVLSACDTGVGRVTGGEGVAGLQQAFHLAGAQSVLATLWKVSDRYTAELMTAFWTAMLAQPDAAVALRQAQLKMIDRYRKDEFFESAHPWLWAAPVLTGGRLR